MKRKFGIAAFAAIIPLAFMLASCAGQPAAVQQAPQIVDTRPDFVQTARQNAPDDVLVGIGFANGSNRNQNPTIAANRARVAIAQEMSSMVQSMIEDFQVSNEMDPQAAISFQRNVSQTLSEANLVGARIWRDGPGPGNEWWVVVWMNKADVNGHINAAQAAARLAVPAMAAFNALDDMDAAFERASRREPNVITN